MTSALMYVLASMFFSMPVCRKPISGIALMTISPSSSTIRRSTPCVLGCCGPMFTSTVSPPSRRSENRCFSSSTVVPSRSCSVLIVGPALFFGVGLLLLDLVEIESELDFFVAQGIVLAQRVAFPVGRHQDTAQIGVAGKLDAEHVVNFPL